MEVHEFVLAIAHREVQDAEHFTRAVLDVVHVTRVLLVQHTATERGHWESCKYATTARRTYGAKVAQRVAVQVQRVHIPNIDLVTYVCLGELRRQCCVVEDRQ